MKFVDLVRIFVEAGNGGHGAVAWRREKYVPRGGPAGGDGGQGGNVVFVADSNLSTLLDFRFRQHLKGESGQPGGTTDKNGRGGEHLTVRVPVGTVVTVEGMADDRSHRPWIRSSDSDSDSRDEELEMIYVVPDDGDADGFVTAEDVYPRIHPISIVPERGDERDTRRDLMRGTVLGDLTSPGQELVVAYGGRGGRGNIHFRSSTNRSPDFAEAGTRGESMWLRLELKLLADVGVVGFPNVGKSTFIRAISRARPRVAAYPFTTLVPQLGVVQLGESRSMVVADVPGLIRGASDGKGLGHQFLRHLERTRVLLHMLAPDPSPGRHLEADLDTIETELARYGGFDEQPRVVALNKVDLLQDPIGRRRIAGLRRMLRERNIPLFLVSAETGDGLEPLLEAIWRRLQAARERAQGAS